MNPVSVHRLGRTFTPQRSRALKDIFLSRPQKKIVACDDITFELKNGELLGIVGPNGSGKTTLLRILATIIFPDNGEALINGFDTVKDGYRVRRSVGFMTSESGSFYTRITGRQNLEFFASLYNLLPAASRARIEELSRLLSLGEVLDRMFQEYSSGMRQRFNLARSLLADPSILLLDEPTKNLDPEAARNIRAFIREELIKKQGKTIVLTSHHLPEVAEIADKVGILKEGKLKAFGTPKELQERSGKSGLEVVYRHYTENA